MNYKRTSLLAGIATLALVTGSDFASAQDNTKGEAGHAATPQATQHMNQGATGAPAAHGAQSTQGGQAQEHGRRAEQNTGAGKTPERAAGESPAAKEQNKAAQSNEMKRPNGNEHSQADKGTQDRNAQERNKGAADNGRPDRGATAQDRDRMGGKNAADSERGRDKAAEQQNRTGGARTDAQRGRTGMEGLQGNASGMNVRLTEQQRTEIRTTIVHASGAPRVGRVDFDVTVGTVVPRDRIEIVPVPETLVRIEPEWRGFLYFVYEDEVVVVNPNDMKIVAVVPA